MRHYPIGSGTPSLFKRFADGAIQFAARENVVDVYYYQLVFATGDGISAVSVLSR